MSTVLVVEDSLTQRELIKELLKEIGLYVIFALDGVEALSMVESACPSLVILDIVMPRMNGYEVCRRLKSNDKTHKLAVVMYSSKSEECDFYWGGKQGADAYVSKLDHPQALVNTVEQLLRKVTTEEAADMAKTATQESELIAQIKRLYSNLRFYKKAQVNPPAWLNRKDLARVVEQIEAQIDELEAQLDGFFALDALVISH
jgi:twitching motility two-component system response regulator PilH